MPTDDSESGGRLSIIVDGQPHECARGSSILAVLQRIGRPVPALCHDDRLKPTGACRSCLVSVAGRPRAVPACTTEVVDGMQIATNTPELVAHRQSLLRMLARHYPSHAVQQFPDKPFHRLLHEYGVNAELDVPADQPERDRSHPYFAVDMTRCIDCCRCVRICNEVQGQGVWHVRDRGTATRIVAAGAMLRDSACVGCGACVDTCPTGALEDATTSPLLPPSQWTRTTCPYCGVGCELSVGTRDGRIASVRPVIDAPVSKGHLCVKGRYAFGFVHAPDRTTRPMIRDGDRWRSTSWPEARAFTGSRLKALIGEYGPDSIGLLGSARATNEDNYVLEKFARTIVGTNNVDSCARVCHAPSAAALRRAFGSGLTTNSFDDIERARTILVCGANVTEDHPVIGARIRQAARRDARLIVIDPRRIELAAEADCHLAVKPGTNVVLLNAMAHVLIQEELIARRFLDARVDGFDAFQQFIQRWTPERATAICGVDAEAIRAAARLYASFGPAMSFHGLGLTEHEQGTDGVLALINLALLTGNVGVPGGGVNPLRGQNNVQGSAHMGCDPAMLPGSTPLEEGRSAFEQRWGRPLPRTGGMNLMEMMDAALNGRLRGLWVMGYDILLTNPDVSVTARALRSLDLVIVQDLFLNETARECATVFLPACSTFEKDGTFMNAERRIQRVRAALRPVGESRPDWQILAETARSMGGDGFSFSSPEEIWDEVRSLSTGARGMTYARLDRAGLQWPCPTDDHPGTAILHTQTFGNGLRATLHRVEYQPAAEQSSAEYPFVLITGRSLYQFNAGTMTGRTRNRELRPTDLIDISNDDAARTGASEGDRVRITSRYGSVILPVHISPEVNAGQLFATFQDCRTAVNAVTGPLRDSTTSTPAYKVTAVKLEQLAPGSR